MTGRDKVAVRHVEVFLSRRSGVQIQVPCWCFIGTDHRYDEWLGPESTPAVVPPGAP